MFTKHHCKEIYQLKIFLNMIRLKISIRVEVRLVLEESNVQITV